jgi:hypothetical protein
LVHADYDAYVSMVRPPKESNPFQAKGALHTAFSPQGYYYGPLGTFPNIPDMGKYAIFLQLRDFARCAHLALLFHPIQPRTNQPESYQAPEAIALHKH